MKKKHLAILLAAAMTVTSVDGTALAVSGADFSSEPAEEAQAEETAAEAVDEDTEEISADDFSAEAGEETAAPEQQETESESETNETTETGEPVAPDTLAGTDISAGTDASAEESAETEDLSQPEELTQDSSADAEKDADAAAEDVEELNAGEDSEFNAGEDTASANSVIPVSVQAMTEGQSYDVNIDEAGKRAWFSFTATEDGTYVFASEGEYDTFGYAYDKADPASENDYLTGNDDGGIGQNFRVEVSMTKGTTYYFCAKLYSETDTGNFSVKLSKIIKPTSIQLDTTSITKTEYKANFENIYLDGLKLNLQYGNGIPSETITFAGEDSIMDSHGNEFTYNLLKKDDSDTELGAGSTLYEGEYTITIYCNSQKMDVSSDFTIKATNKELPSLSVGSDNPIESGIGGYKWYSFTAPETAEYYVSPADNFQLRVKTETGWDSEDCDYIDGDAGLYLISVEKGKTYYLGFNGTRKAADGTSTTKWNVTLKKKPQITALTFSEKELTFTNGLDYIYSYTPAGKVTVNYSDGSEPDVLDVMFGSSTEDRDGNRIRSKVTDSTGKEVQWFDEDSYEDFYLQEGSYKLTYVYEKGNTVVSSAEIPLKVQKIDYDRFQKLSLGKNTVNLQAGDYGRSYWYAFDVEKTGTYRIDDEEDYDLSEAWKKVNDDGSLENYDPGWDGRGQVFEAGRYVVSWYCYDDQTQATMNVKKFPTLNSVKVKSYSPSDMTFLEKTGDPHLDELVVEAVYDDGTTKELTLDNSGDDEYGRLSYELASVDENGKYTEIETSDDSDGSTYLPAGNYVYRVSVNGMYAQDIPVKVVPMESYAKQELNSGTTEVKNQDKLVLKYKAPADGRYELETNVPVSNFKILEAKGDSPANCVAEDYKFYANLKKDTEYYIYVAADEYCPELKATVSSVTKPVSMTTTALKKNYIAGVDCFKESEMQTIVNFGDNKSRVVRGSDLVNGYYIHYEVVNSNGDAYEDEYMPLTAGTWTVTAYLSARSVTAGQKAAEMSDIPVASDTITVKKMDLTTLPVLKEDTWENVEDTALTKRYYAFTASADGTYTCQDEDDEKKLNDVRFYKDADNGYKEMGETITLEKGETCLVTVASAADCKIRIVNKYANSETPEEVKSLQLTDGMEKAIMYKGEEIPCTFTPTEDGYYEMSSSYLRETRMDTYVSLVCGDGEIASDDDSGENSNFKLAYKLEKGKTYTYYPRLYRESDSGAFKIYFHKIAALQIKDFEIVAKEGVNLDQLTLFDDIRNYSDLKLIYADGTSATIGWFNRTDDHGNTLYTDVSQDTKPSVKEKEVLYTATILHNLAGQKQERLQKQIKTKGIAAMEEAKEAADTTIVEGEKYYRFTPATDGEYIFSTNKEANTGSSDGIFGYGRRYSTVWGLTDLGTTYEGESTYSVQLKAGETYVICTYGMKGVTDKTFRVQKAKKNLKGLELVKAPNKTTCLPNDVNAVSLAGMQVKALYTDGSTETITYGSADSSGRYIHSGSVKWLENGKCIAYAKLGKYQVGFELDADSWEQVQVLKFGEKTALKAQRDDIVTLKFVPTRTNLYRFMIANGHVGGEIKGEDPSDDCQYVGNCYLKEGKTYYIHVYADQADPTITAEYADCIWEVTSDIAATCTTDGKKTETCKKHGDTKETITPATGHKYDDGEITKKATCTENGVKTYTCSVCKGTKTEVIKKTGHKFGKWVKISDATIKAKQKQKRICSVCKKATYRTVGSVLKPTIKLNVTSVTLQQKQATKAVKVKMAKGDAVKSWASSNKKIVTVDKKGVIRAQKKNGTAKITVTLKSGKKAILTVKVQSKKIATSRITGLKSKVTLSKGKKLTLKPVLSPLTSQDKITYTTSNKTVATVTGSGIITAKKKGTARITVKAGKKSYVVTVTVK